MRELVLSRTTFAKEDLSGSETEGGPHNRPKVGPHWFGGAVCRTISAGYNDTASAHKRMCFLILPEKKKTKQDKTKQAYDKFFEGAHKLIHKETPLRPLSKYECLRKNLALSETVA